MPLCCSRSRRCWPRCLWCCSLRLLRFSAAHGVGMSLVGAAFVRCAALRAPLWVALPFECVTLAFRLCVGALPATSSRFAPCLPLCCLLVCGQARLSWRLASCAVLVLPSIRQFSPLPSCFGWFRVCPQCSVLCVFPVAVVFIRMFHVQLETQLRYSRTSFSIVVGSVVLLPHWCILFMSGQRVRYTRNTLGVTACPFFRRWRDVPKRSMWLGRIASAFLGGWNSSSFDLLELAEATSWSWHAPASRMTLFRAWQFFFFAVGSTGDSLGGMS